MRGQPPHPSATDAQQARDDGRAGRRFLRQRRPVRDESRLEVEDQTVRDQGRAREWMWAAVEVILLLLTALLIGAITSWVRFRTARLPAWSATGHLGVWSLLLTGVRWLALMVVAFGLLSVVAYLLAGRRWGERRLEWHRLVRHGLEGARHPDRGWGTEREGDETAPLGENAVRILAGVNLAVLCGVVTAIVVTTVDRVLISSLWVLVPLGLVAFFGMYKLLTDWGPLKVGPRTHASIWLVVALIAALVTTLPLGLLILVGVGISTLGRVVARTELPRKPSEFLRSPLPWMMIVVYTIVGAAYYAVPPVPFQRDVLFTASGERVAGYLAGTGSGTYVVTCEALADATAYEPRVVFVPASQASHSKLGGSTYYVDSGDRPSLATLGERLLGVSIRLPVPLGTGLRPTEPTCGGSGPTKLSHGFMDPALGEGVIAGPAPVGGRAVSGEEPIEQTTPAIAGLAREMQPILEVSVADENWPVSVGALLADRGPDGTVSCLHEQQAPKLVCPVSLTTLSRSRGDSADYLQYPTPQATSSSPSPLSGEPLSELGPFETGQGTAIGSLHHWLADPGILNPWATAQIYFVDAGRVPAGFPGWPVRDPRVPAGLLNLEYWFFYQYNYFPTVFDRSLMNQAPLAGDLVNTDLHQGDWEHVDVLVDPVTHAPEWLYLARHSNEGTFLPWGSLASALAGTHPIIQAAFGGHPSYTVCGEHQRNTPVPLSDWVVCGYPRFAFRATTTPLVDLRAMPWACWEGHFGYAGPGTISTAHSSLLDQANTAYYDVAGPPTPLLQAENSKLGLCAHGAPA
jgi:hypothetical protein